MTRGNGHLFPKREAEASERMVLLAGRRVASTFRMGRAEFLAELRVPWCVRAFVIPYPSGVVRWWNLAADRRRVGWLLARLAGRGM